MADELLLDDKEQDLVNTDETTTDVAAIEADLQLGEDEIKFIRESGGVEWLQQAKELYETFATPDEEAFKPQDFLTKLKQFSPNRYNDIAETMYESHKRDFQSWALEDLKISTTDVQAAKEWLAAGKPSGKEDDELDGLDPNSALYKELMEARKERAQSQKDREDYERRLQEKQIAEYREAIAQVSNEFSEERLSLIRQEVGKLKLGDDDLGKRAAIAIEAYAQQLFNDDQKAKTKYSSAMQLLSKGEVNLAKSMAGDIDRKISFYTAQAAQFIGDLLLAKREKQGTSTAAIKSRTDIASSAGTAKPTSALPDKGGRERAQFSPWAAQKEKLKALEAEGKFSS